MVPLNPVVLSPTMAVESRKQKGQAPCAGARADDGVAGKGMIKGVHPFPNSGFRH